MLLAGDIGGTKTDLAICSPAAGPRSPLVQAEFHSANYASLTAMVQEFLATVDMPVTQACFDVAGPVLAGQAKVTNLPWVIDAATLQQELKVNAVWLLNDLEATAWAIPILQPDELHTLHRGQPVAGGTIAVIAPGTGLGEGFLIWDGVRYRPYPSEGGHADFAPTTAEQIGLLRYLQRRYDHVSVERVCSGIGIPNIYDYLRENSNTPEVPDIAHQLAATADRTPVIVAAALHPAAPNPLSAATLNLFVAILAAETSNLALKVLATGGVYLAGGIPMHILPALADGRFVQQFQRKGRFVELLSHIPIQVVTRQVALLGAARYGLEEMQKCNLA